MQDYYNSDELMHYGRKGMKWGQNIFGKVKSAVGRAKKRREDKKEEEVKKSRSKITSSRKLTNEELKQRIDRMRLEDDYNQLMRKVDPVRSTKGRDFVLNVLEKIGENTLTNLGTQTANKLIGDAINKAAKVKSDDTINRIVNPNKGQSDKK